MKEEIFNGIEKYILSLDLDDNIKNDILITFIRYKDIVIKFYKNAYDKNKKVATEYLMAASCMFKDRLDGFLLSDINPLVYIDYISSNMGMYRKIKKVNLNRQEQERFEEIYNRIINGTYMKTFYEEIFTYSSKNFDIVCFDLYRLAIYMGYNDELDDNIDGPFVKKMVPNNIKMTLIE